MHQLNVDRKNQIAKIFPLIDFQNFKRTCTFDSQLLNKPRMNRRRTHHQKWHSDSKKDYAFWTNKRKMGSRKAQENVGQNGTLNQSYIKMQKQLQKHSIIDF